MAAVERARPSRSGLLAAAIAIAAMTAGVACEDTNFEIGSKSKLSGDIEYCFDLPDDMLELVYTWDVQNPFTFPPTKGATSFKIKNKLDPDALPDALVFEYRHYRSGSLLNTVVFTDEVDEKGKAKENFGPMTYDTGDQLEVWVGGVGGGIPNGTRFRWETTGKYVSSFGS